MGRSEGDVRFEKLLRSLGYAVLRLQQASEPGSSGDVELREVRFKLDCDNRTSVLVICKGVRGSASEVAFVGAPDLETAVLAVGKAIAGGALKWREDRPWGG